MLVAASLSYLGRRGAGGAALPTVTWNPSDKSLLVNLTGGDLIATRNTLVAGAASARATRGIDAASDSGYFEAVLNSTQNGDTCIGIGNAAADLNNYVGGNTNGWSYLSGGTKYYNSTSTAYGASYASDGTVVGIAVKNGKVWFARNGSWQNSGDPAAGTGEAFSGITGTVFPMLSEAFGNIQWAGRFKPADFSYSPPSGFSPWGG